MAGILDILYPQGNYLDIKENAPTRRDYNIQVNADLARNLPGGIVKDIVAPTAAAALSLPYDAIQAYQRMQPGTGIKGYYDAFMAEDPFSSLGQRFIGASAPLAERLANLNLKESLSNLFFTPVGAAEVQSKNPFNNMISDTALAEPRRQSEFQDYPGVQNLGSVQNFDREGIQDIISRMEEEKGNYIERPEDRFSLDGIMQNLGGYAKDYAGRYIGSQALGGAGAMLLGPIGGLIGGIAGLLGGGDLFNQNSYSQQMYNNLTPEGKTYASSLYGPGGILQGYNQISAFGRGTLGTIGNILANNPNMSATRKSAFRKAADDYISGIDPTQQGINAVTKPGTYSYDDSIINYAPPSGGDSGGSSGGETYGNVGSYEDFGSTY